MEVRGGGGGEISGSKGVAGGRAGQAWGRVGKESLWLVAGVKVRSRSVQWVGGALMIWEAWVSRGAGTRQE